MFDKMSQSTSRGPRCVGDYVVVQRIGSGSFSVVWHGKHRVTGADVAIKEIVTGRLNKKLHESLMSEIRILKHIEHPNIIHLHDIIEETGRLHLILEYCRGGDLFMYIEQRQGRISEGTAKYFMQQLATGLQVLRQNNLIHRDLKPQNLLLSTNHETAILKIADFGFARSLDPRNLAETLCGSPLYMAPEIMQVQKYDAKADLWSVGAILFQLVTGKPPFTGNNQIQLLQNIVKSTELQFPSDKKDLSSDCVDLCRKLLRRNPVERLTFEEFFNHPFLSQRQPDESLRCQRSPGKKDLVKAEESSREHCLLFSIDNDPSGLEGNSSSARHRPPMKSTYGFSVDNEADKTEVSNALDNMDTASTYRTLTHKPENTGFGLDRLTTTEEKLKESFKSHDRGPLSSLSEVADSLELIQDYVIVSGPPLDLSSSSQAASKLSHLPCALENTQQACANVTSMSIGPMPIIGTSSRSLESHGSVPSQGSMDMGDALEQPSTNCVTRIKSLQRFASAIKELVNEKVEGGRQLEAFSIQLVILAIWKQALHICHTQAVSAIEGSPTCDMAKLRGSGTTMHDHGGSSSVANICGPQDTCSQIEREFLAEVGNAEELAKVIDPGNTDMPDAMETIYQSALTLGKNGAIDEYMGNGERSAVNYAKAVRLFTFLLIEAPSLILNPPFSLTATDQYRLQSYIDALKNRQSHSRSQRMALLKCEDQRGTP